MKEKTIKAILENKIIAIVRNISPYKVLPLAQALYDGGIRLVEVTFNQAHENGEDETAGIIKKLNEQLGDRMCIGAGTVMTVRQAKIAFDSGAEYLISPNTDIEVIKKAGDLGIESIPGALTPSEAVLAHNNGADFVKLFPAGELGTDYIKALMAPLNHISFLAVGGIDTDNIRQFQALGIKGFGIGSNIVKASLVNQDKYADIALLASKFVQNIKME